jgi:uncharacterized repeat protein (TIGR03847 family)
MARQEIELEQIEFITIGTVGPKGRRQFYLQAGGREQIVSLTIEKAEARQLSEALNEMLDDLVKRSGGLITAEHVDLGSLNMDLRDPIDPLFRVGRIGIAYDPERDQILLEAQEFLGLLFGEESQEEEAAESSVVRFWATRAQMRALAMHAQSIVRQGRVDPQSNGRLLYYWA